MKKIKVVVISSLVILLGIQLIPIKRNISKKVPPTDFIKMYNPPIHIRGILHNACYDCHSNNTVYPWYANMQPMGWLMASHIKNGKGELNLSEFGTYSNRKQGSKLKSMVNQIEDDEMPLTSYKIMHQNARLGKQVRDELLTYLDSLRNTISDN